MVTTLYLIRHGAIKGGGAKRYYGSIDVPLSEAGIGQMRRISAFVAAHLKDSGESKGTSYLRDVHGAAETGLPSTRLRAVYASTLSRAIKSAEIVAEPHGLRIITVPALRERSFGVWEGMTFTEIREQYPAEFEAWASNPLIYSPIGGESTLEVKDRVILEFERIVRDHPGEDIAVIAHGGVNRIILCHILGIPLENIFRIEQDHGAVSIIEFWEKYPVVKVMNRTCDE